MLKLMAPAILGVIGGRVARYLGVIGVLIPLGVYFYYVFIESWCLGYCVQFLQGGTSTLPASGFVLDRDQGEQREGRETMPAHLVGPATGPVRVAVAHEDTVRVQRARRLRQRVVADQLRRRLPLLDAHRAHLEGA